MKQGVLVVTLVVETEDHNMDWTKRYLKSGIVTAFPGLKSANLAIQILDEDVEDRVLYINKLGHPSKEMKELADEMFAPEPQEAQPA
jgi:hypothetical protein